MLRSSAERKLGRCARIIALAAVLFSPADGTWWPFRREDRAAKKPPGIVPVPRATVLNIPDSVYGGVTASGSWCRRAAQGARRTCDLLDERERMHLATLVANCHLESSNRPPIQWHPTDRLKDASHDHVSLVTLVAGQLETVCMSFGVPWPFALATEQGERFKELQENVAASLAELLGAASGMKDSSAESVRAAKEVAHFGDLVTNVQQQVIDQTRNMDALSRRLSDQIASVKEAGERALDAQRAMTVTMHEFTSSVSSTLNDLPNATEAFVRNSDRFATLLQQHRQTAATRHPPAASGFALLPVLMLCAGLFCTDGARHVFAAAVVVALLKAYTAETAVGVTDLLSPIGLVRYGCMFLLDAVPHQALLFAATLAILWEATPAALRNSLMIGDQAPVAQARADAADASARERTAADKVARLLDDHDKASAAVSRLAKEVAALTAQLETRDGTIASLERRVEAAGSLPRESLSTVGTARARTCRDALEQKQKTLAAQRGEADAVNANLAGLTTQLLASGADAERAGKTAAAVPAEREAILEQEGKEAATRRDSTRSLQDDIAKLKIELLGSTRQLATAKDNENKLRAEKERMIERETLATLELQNLKKKAERGAKPRPKLARAASFRRPAPDDGKQPRAEPAEMDEDDEGGDAGNVDLKVSVKERHSGNKNAACDESGGGKHGGHRRDVAPPLAASRFASLFTTDTTDPPPLRREASDGGIRSRLRSAGTPVGKFQP